MSPTPKAKPITVKDLIKFREVHGLSLIDFCKLFGFSHPSKWSALSTSEKPSDLKKPVSATRAITYRWYTNHPEMIPRSEEDVTAIYDKLSTMLNKKIKRGEFSRSLGKPDSYYSRAMSRNDAPTEETKSILNLLGGLLESGDEATVQEFLALANIEAELRGETLSISSDNRIKSVKKKKT